MRKNKENCVMKKTTSKSILFLPVCLSLLFILVIPAAAWPPPPCPDCSYWDGSSCICDVEVTSVTSDKDVACVGCDITFTATISGSCSCVSWSGGGDPASGSGCTFTTHWDGYGTKTVIASCCSNSKSKQVTIAAPTNFHQTDWKDLGDGRLAFKYEWDSTTGDGNEADLSGCKVGEIVDYPGTDDPYCFPSPPWSHCWDNPTIKDLNATLGVLIDIHKTGTFMKPYQFAWVPALQVYRYRRCTGEYTILMGIIPIDRFVYWVDFPDYTWRYVITKSGRWAEKDLD